MKCEGYTIKYYLGKDNILYDNYDRKVDITPALIRGNFFVVQSLSDKIHTGHAIEDGVLCKWVDYNDVSETLKNIWNATQKMGPSVERKMMQDVIKEEAGEELLK